MLTPRAHLVESSPSARRAAFPTSLYAAEPPALAPDRLGQSMGDYRKVTPSKLAVRYDLIRRALEHTKVASSGARWRHHRTPPLIDLVLGGCKSVCRRECESDPLAVELRGAHAGCERKSAKRLSRQTDGEEIGLGERERRETQEREGQTRGCPWRTMAGRTTLFDSRGSTWPCPEVDNRTERRCAARATKRPLRRFGSCWECWRAGYVPLSSLRRAHPTRSRVV